MKAQQETWKPLKRFFKMLQLDRKEISYIYVFAIFSGLITLSLPLGVQAIIGQIAGGNYSWSLFLLVTMVTAGTFLTGVLMTMQLTVTEMIQRRIFSRSAFEFAYRIPKLKMEIMARQYPPELVNRFFDTINLQKGLPKILMDFSTAILQIIFSLILLSFYHPFFVFFGILVLLIILLVFYYSGPIGVKTSLKESKYKYAVAYWLEEIARSLMAFKLTGGSYLNLEKTDELVGGYLSARKGHFKVLLSQYWIIVGFKTIITGVLLLLGSVLVINNQLNIGQFVAAEIIVLLVVASVEKLILSLETIYDVLTAVEKIGAVTDLDLENQGGFEYGPNADSRGMSIDLQEVGYLFPNSTTFSLKGITTRIEAGQTICISGQHRAGKSTLLQLLAGLIVDYTGSIAINGVPIGDYDSSSIRKEIGTVFSRDDIFSGTILENISMNRPLITDALAIETAENLGLSAWVRQLPEGYHTQLLPGGRNIPTGIRAKIILCRAIIAQPKLLLMEDFFSLLNPDEQETIAPILFRPANNRTTVVVSNNPKLAALCTKVLWMEDGRVLEEGPFSDMPQNHPFRKTFC